MSDPRDTRPADQFGLGIMADGTVNVVPTLEDYQRRVIERDAEEAADAEEDFGDLLDGEDPEEDDHL